MNLIIDVGNTLIKLAVFQDNMLLEKKTCPYDDFNINYENLKKTYPKLKHAIISNVGKVETSVFNILDKDLNVLTLSHKTEIPFKNLYSTPKTLGVDRVALVSASVQHYSDSNVLIIDAGTCITYDFINTDNEYLGGSISPGIRLRYKVLNNLTANLPLLKTNTPKHIIGDSTENAIHSGVVFGVVNEIDGIIDTYKAKHQDLTVILTGGDAKFLSNQLKNSIFANSNFLLEGLNFILDYNSK